MFWQLLPVLATAALILVTVTIGVAVAGSAASGDPAVIYACGPYAMLQRIAQTAEESKIPAELSLESLMGCGFGACWGCVKKIKKDKYLYSLFKKLKLKNSFYKFIKSEKELQNRH